VVADQEDVAVQLDGVVDVVELALLEPEQVDGRVVGLLALTPCEQGERCERSQQQRSAKQIGGAHDGAARSLTACRCRWCGSPSRSGLRRNAHPAATAATRARVAG